MTHKIWMMSLFALSVAGAAVAFAVQGDTPSAERGAPQEGTMPDMMGAKPTEHHKVLAQMSGTWTATLEFPGMEPQQGVENNQMAMGGLWLVGDFEIADFMGAPFRGHSVMGYDSTKGKYVGMWVDSMTDRIVHSEGEYDSATKQLVMHAENLDPMTGEPRKEVHVTLLRGPDSRLFKMTPEGSDEPTMVIEYTRKK